jgi:serine protease Do
MRTSPSPSADARARELPDFSGLVDAYGKAVVNVMSVRSVSPTPDDDPLGQFFRRFGAPGAPGGTSPQSQPAPPVQRGEGSGFIVSPEGYVLTNAHVVDQSTEVTVKLTDRREFAAKVVGVDARGDVAVLKIDARDLPTVKTGDPARLKPGQWVVAIGSPFGFENSVTAGVVSATSRAVGADNSIVPFIQTDVAVNPGNSGGPLFNLDGEVVGINSMIYSGTGGYQGVSFAIPIDVALDVQQQLMKTGHVTRGRLGVTVQDVNSQLAESFGLDRPRGALVSTVEKGGPAETAGLKPGDIILGVDGRPIELSTQLPGLVAHLRPGTTTTLNVWRNRRIQQLNVRVGELEEPRDEKTANRGRGAGKSAPALGLAVRPLTAEERGEVGADDGGLVVEEASGPAASAGIQSGDVILRIDDRPVKSVDDLRQAAKSNGTVALLVQRQDARIYVPLRPGL